LRGRFDKDKGYADKDVVFLDPAAGTAAYPLAMIEHTLTQVEKRWGKGMVAGAAGELARNAHAFEILVGPYAVAHLRISEAIRGQRLSTWPRFRGHASENAGSL
jgi:predicted helicase